MFHKACMIVLTILASGWATPALAQEVGNLSEPAQAAWIPIVIAIVFVLMVAGVSFKTSKRSHQD